MSPTGTPQPGKPHPLGARPTRTGVNFCVYSRNASAVALLLYDDVNADQPSRVLALDAHRHRTWHYWHLFLPLLPPGLCWEKL